MGRQNEAERVVTEFIESKGGEQAIWKIISEEEPPMRVEEIVKELFQSASGFYLENDSYCRDYKMHVQDGDEENCYQITIAYIY